MSKIDSLDSIESVVVHWSESDLINNELGEDDGDIEKTVTAAELDDLIKRSAQLISTGHDKLSLSIVLKTRTQWCVQSKFYVNSKDLGLLSVINKGQ